MSTGDYLDTLLKIKQLERRLDLYNHYNMVPEAEAVARQLQLLRQQARTVGAIKGNTYEYRNRKG